MSPVDPLSPAPRHTDAPGPVERLYTLLVFDDLMPAPWVTLVEAENDIEAMKLARHLHPSKRRELWYGHLIVAKID